MGTLVHQGMIVGVDKGAKYLQTEARADAPKDTTSLEKSIYIVTPLSNDYDESVAAAEGVNPKVEVLPMEQPANDASALVGVAATHGQFQEFGTDKQPAQPFMTTSSEKAVKEVANIIASEIAEKLK